MKKLGCEGVGEGLLGIPHGSGMGCGAGEAVAESHDMVGRAEVGKAVTGLLRGASGLHGNTVNL